MGSAAVVRIERVRGASIGATVMGGFGAAWLTLGMASTAVPTRIALVVVLPVLAAIAWLGWAARRRLPRVVETSEKRQEKRQEMRAFAVVNVVQWFAIFGTVNLLRNLHWEAWAIPAIVLIVGAHFLPLAQIFQARAHLATGIALLLLALAAIALPISVRDTVECLAAGLILWASAANALRVAFRMTTERPLVAGACV